MTNQIETTLQDAVIEEILKKSPKYLEELITVCDKCFMASCWHGIFMCDNARLAGTVEKTREELIKLNREHPDYITNNPKPLW